MGSKSLQTRNGQNNGQHWRCVRGTSMTAKIVAGINVRDVKVNVMELKTRQSVITAEEVSQC